MSSVRRCFLALLLGAAMVIVVLSPAHALDCVGMPDQLAPDRSAFTGRIVDVDHRGARTEGGDLGTRIQVDVEEIWSGLPVHDPLWLEAELDGWWDVEGGRFRNGYASEESWLFLPYTGDQGTESVNPCNAWPAARDGSEKLRPAHVRPSVEDVGRSTAAATEGPRPASASDEGQSRTWILAGAGAGVAVLLVVLGRRLRRRTG